MTGRARRYLTFGFCTAVAAVLAAGSVLAQSDEISRLSDAGRAIYTKDGACITCHLADASGNPQVNAKPLQFGPTPLDIHNALNSVPQMGPIAQQLQLEKPDLLALSVYLRDLVGLTVDAAALAALRATLAEIKVNTRDAGFVLTERDRMIDKYAHFNTVLETWQRKAKTGSIRRDYQSQVVQTWPAGKPKFKPRPGRTYFYQNTGNRGDMFGQGFGMGAGNAITVGDAKTLKVIAQYRLDPELRGSVHATGMTPDGRYGYIIGPSIKRENNQQATSLDSADELGILRVSGRLNIPATIIKWDALTLQPVKMFTIGGRLHHLQAFQDRYMLLDTFSRDDDGLDVFLLDPDSDRIVGGVRDEELGGVSYTAFSDGRFIYILMQPHGYGPFALSGYVGANMLTYGKNTVLRPFWVARIDPVTWEVVQEYPYPGYRGDWICFDGDKRYMYIPSAGSSNLTKIDIASGEIMWVNPTGIGPYGCNLNADNSEVWVADKGEANGFFGRTATVLKADTGRAIATLVSGYMVDHMLLAPNGKQFWATSNAEGQIYVFDALEKRLIKKIQIPGGGDAHGLPWVYYDQHGKSMLARDQGGFRNGIDPRNGHALDY